MPGRQSSRIQQAPAELPRRAVPTSVEFEPLSRREMGLHSSQSSQPIPIKKCRLSPQEIEDEAASEDSATHYDWATWRMYDRITTARRLRAAVSRNNSDCGGPVQHRHQHSVMMTRDYHHASAFTQDQMMHPEEQVMSHISMQPSMEEDDDGVFDFDAM